MARTNGREDLPEQSAGVWWQVERQRVYDKASANGFRQTERRMRLGLSLGSYVITIAPDGSKTVTTVTVERANRKQTTVVTHPHTETKTEMVEVNGLLKSQKSPETLGREVSFSYNSQRLQTKVTSMYGEEINYTYDDYVLRDSVMYETRRKRAEYNHQKFSVTYAYHPYNNIGAGLLSSKVTHKYEISGQVTEEYSYDGMGSSRSESDPSFCL